MVNARDPIVNGKDFNFFQKVTVDGYEFPQLADVAISFRGQFSFTLVNEGNNVIEYSFNGNTLHGDLTPDTPTSALAFDNRRISKIWFRAPGGGDPVVRIEAWTAAG